MAGSDKSHEYYIYENIVLSRIMFSGITSISNIKTGGRGCYVKGMLMCWAGLCG